MGRSSSRGFLHPSYTPKPCPTFTSGVGRGFSYTNGLVAMHTRLTRTVSSVESSLRNNRVHWIGLLRICGAMCRPSKVGMGWMKAPRVLILWLQSCIRSRVRTIYLYKITTVFPQYTATARLRITLISVGLTSSTSTVCPVSTYVRLLVLQRDGPKRGDSCQCHQSMNYSYIASQVP
jgi:hypothetical protein